ncbi:MAG: class I SAM-dependent methyltransferase, partial [Acidobacteriia bacterium]|nr:class I SAM-dependent methyltransferase [Terriglobia bacterium]
MQLLNRWLRDSSVTERVLDLGCGTGSLPSELAGLKVIAADIDPVSLARNPGWARVCAHSHKLPFPDESFSLVICHHSLEHFGDIEGSIGEIRRVLNPAGHLFVSVPDGMSFSDRLYRLLFCGGGHIQKFSLNSAVSA